MKVETPIPDKFLPVRQVETGHYTLSINPLTTLYEEKKILFSLTLY